MKSDAQASEIRTLHLGLAGWPLGHSFSPCLHNAALAALSLAGEYRLFPIPPLPEGQEALARLLDRVRKGELHGLNVTIPHKQNVLPLLDELTPAARLAGAANTLYMKDGRLVGDNTDVPGFLADLQRAGFIPTGAGEKRALVLGAGGAGRGVGYALAQAGWQVWISARRPEQARALANSLLAISTAIQSLPWQPEAWPDGCDLVVNATPLGMFPDVESSPWPLGLPFPAGACVYDLVYNPPETRLARQARSAGLRAATGLGMLVEQAALAFETWSGQAAPRQAMWEAVLAEQEKP